MTKVGKLGNWGGFFWRTTSMDVSFLTFAKSQNMQIASINVGLPQQVAYQGKMYNTGIFKFPILDAVWVHPTQIVGDGQGDLKHHGGPDKAVYAYDVAHYDFWKTHLPELKFPKGAFGENLTTVGLLDEEVRIGDVYQLGTVMLQVAQPRFPCMKLNIRFNRPDMLSLFLEAKRFGIYFRVIQSGYFQSGDKITIIEQSPIPLTVKEVAIMLCKGTPSSLDAWDLALKHPHLADRPRQKLQTYKP